MKAPAGLPELRKNHSSNVVFLENITCKSSTAITKDYFIIISNISKVVPSPDWGVATSTAFRLDGRNEKK